MTREQNISTVNPLGKTPPIQPGTKILEHTEFGVIFARYYEDGKTIKGWYLVVGDKTPSDPGYTEMRIADGYEVWCSEFSKVNDPSTGKDIGCIFGEDLIYIFKKVEAPVSDPQISLFWQKRTDPNTKKSNRCIVFPSMSIDMSTGGKSQMRFLYCVSVQQTNTKQNGEEKTFTLYDVYDPSFSIPLPFASAGIESIYSCIKAMSSYQTFLIFDGICYLKKNKTSVPTSKLLVISEADMFAFAAASKNVQLEDFSECDFDAGHYIVDCIVGNYYYDRTNPGAQQLAVSIAILSGTTPQEAYISLALLAFSSENKLYSLATPASSSASDLVTFRNNNFIYPLKITTHKNRGTITHFINPNGIHGFSTIYCRFTGDWQPWMELTLWRFDIEEKKLLPEDQCIICVDTIKPSWQRASLFISCTPTFAWNKRDKKMSLDLQSFRVLFRYLVLDDEANIVKGTPIMLIGTSINEFYVENGLYQFKNDLYNVTILGDCYNAQVIPQRTGNINDFSPEEIGYFLCANIDFSGNSISVGVPKLTENNKSMQVIGLYRCIPFDVRQYQMLPSVLISTSETVMTGISKSTHSSWQSGYNVSANVSYLVFSVNAHYGESVGGSNLHMKTDQSTISLHVSSGIADTDILHCYGSQFYLWEYPLYQKTTMDKPFDYLTVLIPDGFTDALLDTTDDRFAYDQDYEIGQILTYLDAVKPGYDPDRLWFNKTTFTCTADSQGGGTTLTYSKDNSTHTEEQNSIEDGINASVSIGLNFGEAGMSLSGHYTKHNVKNSATSTTRSDNLTITFHSGVVKDSGYEYTITPIVYTHAKNNMLIIACDIELTGPSWKQLYQTPQIILMRVYPFTKDPKILHFSRSIRFFEKSDDSVDVNVCVFNNSFSLARSIVCRIYTGMGVYLSEKKPDISRCTLIDTLNLDSLDGLERHTFSSLHHTLPKNTVVTVEVFQDDFEDVTKKIYWGIYPYDAFGQAQFSTASTN